jgi:PHD/YefM family antitoxin component YafN of YafNO toxin-antitoxin module
MKISITEFNDNISFYILKSKHEPIELTKRGILVAAIINKFNYEKYKSQNQTRPGKTK